MFSIKKFAIRTEVLIFGIWGQKCYIPIWTIFSRGTIHPFRTIFRVKLNASDFYLATYRSQMPPGKSKITMELGEGTTILETCFYVILLRELTH